MCGIYGYVGKTTELGRQVLTSLKALERRGYDSWGVAIGNDGSIAYEKKTGKIGNSVIDFPPSDIGFGHTRWATHGGVTTENAHPHVDSAGRRAVIHNGIVENHANLRQQLEAAGYVFRSETDTESVLYLLDQATKDTPDLAVAMARVFNQIKGHNAVIVLDSHTKELVGATSGSELVIGANHGHAWTIASESLALLSHADRVHHMEQGQMVRLTQGGVELFKMGTHGNLEIITPTYVDLKVKAEDIDLGGHPHFMIKEICQQPAVLRKVARNKSQIMALAEAIAAADDVYLIGCGTAHNAAELAGRYLAEIAGKRVRVKSASEFHSEITFLTPKSLVVGLSQSGSTLDVLNAMSQARTKGARLAAVVNVADSTLDRMVDLRVHLLAGPEQCVLATKSYMAKVATMLLTAYAMTGQFKEGQILIRQAAREIERSLRARRRQIVTDAALRCVDAQSLFVIGRGLSHPAALEGALKIKESTYIHAEGFAGGDLKHGVIALIESGVPVIVLAPDDDTRSDIISAANEVKARGALVIGIGPSNDTSFDLHIPTAELGKASGLVQATPIQLLAYLITIMRGLDPDKPRNLAKSVTVK